MTLKQAQKLYSDAISIEMWHKAGSVDADFLHKAAKQCAGEDVGILYTNVGKKKSVVIYSKMAGKTLDKI